MYIYVHRRFFWVPGFWFDPRLGPVPARGTPSGGSVGIFFPSQPKLSSPPTFASPETDHTPPWGDPASQHTFHHVFQPAPPHRAANPPSRAAGQSQVGPKIISVRVF